MEQETKLPSEAGVPPPDFSSGQRPSDFLAKAAAAVREQPGWGVLLFLAFALLVIGLLAAPVLGVADHFHLPNYVSMGLGELAQAAGVMVVTAAMAAIERRPFRSYGLRPRNGLRHFLLGTVWGFLALTAMLVAMRLAGHFYFGGMAESPAAAIRFGLFWLAVFLLVGIFEEVCFRGYLLYTLARGLGFWPAAILVAALFGLMHRGNSGESTYGVIAAGLFGLFITLTLKRTGALWWAIGFHMAWDYSESFIYSVPDSGTISPGHLLRSNFTGPAWITGGSVGPEGSLFIFPLLGVMALLFSLVYHKSELTKEDYAPKSLNR